MISRARLKVFSIFSAIIGFMLGTFTNERESPAPSAVEYMPSVLDKTRTRTGMDVDRFYLLSGAGNTYANPADALAAGAAWEANFPDDNSTGLKNVNGFFKSGGGLVVQFDPVTARISGCLMCDNIECTPILCTIDR